jgi:hypothetical protein
MLWQRLIYIYYRNLKQLFHRDHDPGFMGLVLELIFGLVHEKCAHIQVYKDLVKGVEVGGELDDLAFDQHV